MGGERSFVPVRVNGGNAPIPAVRGTEIEWARLPEADLPVSIPYRDIVELQATTAGVGPDTNEAAFQRLAAVNSSVRRPARQVKRDLPLLKTAGNVILNLETLGIRECRIKPGQFSTEQRL
jgi:hypothetical protein